HEEVSGARDCIEAHARLKSSIGIIIAADRGQRAARAPVDGKSRIVIAAEGIRFDPHVLGRSKSEPYGLVSGYAEWIIGSNRCMGDILAYGEGYRRHNGCVVEVIIRRRWWNDRDVRCCQSSIPRL